MQLKSKAIAESEVALNYKINKDENKRSCWKGHHRPRVTHVTFLFHHYFLFFNLWVNTDCPVTLYHNFIG
jgi:hypothetical protein